MSDAALKCLVTGAAGFIGSHLCEELLRRGHEVVGIDAFIPYYPKDVKEQNQREMLRHPKFHFHPSDLRQDPLEHMVADVDVIFHLAAMPGLIWSWTHFDWYMTCNVQGTQRLLEAIRTAAPALKRLILASTSSVYGRFASGDETLPTKPISPYGVTKLASETLCRAYADAYKIPVVTLRYFSVYGPRQRPDMGYYRFIEALLRGQPITVYGDGKQVRGNTFVSDCVEATILAVNARPGETYNVGGGETANVWDILRHLKDLAGHDTPIHEEPARPGDQRYTFADTSKLREDLGWEPVVSLQDGLANQWTWQRSLTS